MTSLRVTVHVVNPKKTLKPRRTVSGRCHITLIDPTKHCTGAVKF